MSAATTQSAAVADGLESPQRQWAVLAILVATFMANLDAAIANIAMPVISQDLSSSAATTVWVVNAYQLAVGITVLPLAALGERLGYKRVYLGGVLLLACGIGDSGDGGGLGGGDEDVGESGDGNGERLGGGGDGEGLGGDISRGR